MGVPQLDSQQETLTMKPTQYAAESISTSRLNDIDLEHLEVAEKVSSSSRVQPWRVSLTIMNMDVQIVFDISDTVILGRSYPHPIPLRGIDLSPFNGYELGVSRQHASMQLKEDQIIICDHNSNNGTLLNGKLLKPDEDYVLQDKDQISLGKLIFQLNLLFNPFDKKKTQSSKVK